MNVQNSPRARFDVQILDKPSDINRLSELSSYLGTHETVATFAYTKVVNEAPKNEKLYNLFHDSLLEAERIKKIVLNTIVNIGLKRNPSDILKSSQDLKEASKCTVVVAYDSTKKNLPQAIGVIRTDTSLNGTKSIEIINLMTSLWNLGDTSTAIIDKVIAAWRLNNLHYVNQSYKENQAKDAAAAILEFCTRLGKEQNAKSLHVSVNSAALPFFNKHGFKPIEGSKPDILKRQPIFINLDNEAKSTAS